MARNLLGLLLLFCCVSTASAINIEFDYSFDTKGFFDDPERREAMELAGKLMNRYVDNLDAIVPDDDNTWRLLFFTRPDGPTVILDNPVVEQDVFKIYVGGFRLPSDLDPDGNEVVRLAQSLDSAPLALGTPEWEQSVLYRGQAGAAQSPATDFGSWGGTISFQTDIAAVDPNVDVQWHFGTETDELRPTHFDFITVAMHEIGHLLGIGIAPSWRAQIDFASNFIGPESTAVGSSTNANLVTNADRSHWRRNTESTWDGVRQEALLAPAIAPGERQYATLLDLAAFRDIGWEEATKGDATLDRVFDTSDFVSVFQAGKYETSRVAAWSEGDWNDDARFTSIDLVEALRTGTYEQPLAAVADVGTPLNAIAASVNDEPQQVLVGYDALSGDLWIDGGDQLLTSVQIESDDANFSSGEHSELAGAFDISSAEKLFKMQVEGFSQVLFEHAARPGLSQREFEADLRIDGSNILGGGLGDVRFVYQVPEPSSATMLLLALLSSLAGRKSRQ